MSDREVIKVIGDILKNQMALSDGQIMLAYEKFNIPSDAPGLYVALSYISGKAISTNSFFDPDTNVENIDTTLHELIQIDIMSFDSSARIRKQEVIAALTSVFSEQQQERNFMNIGRIPSEFLNASSLEETKFLNRFTMTVAVTSLSRIERYPEYYDQFRTPEVHSNV